MKQLIVLLALVAGCGDVQLAALTVPPPGKVAQLDAEKLTLSISRGVAFAFECTEYNNYSGPCRDTTVSSADPAIATTFDSYLDELATAYDGGDLGPRSKSAFVVVGLAPGATKLTVATKEQDLTVDVTVLP